MASEKSKEKGTGLTRRFSMRHEWTGCQPIIERKRVTPNWLSFPNLRREPDKRTYHNWPVKGNAIKGYYVKMDITGRELIVPISETQLRELYTPARNVRPRVTVTIYSKSKQLKVTDYHTNAPIAEFPYYRRFLKKR